MQGLVVGMLGDTPPIEGEHSFDIVAFDVLREMHSDG
jgi:hypothetical protein